MHETRVDKRHYILANLALATAQVCFGVSAVVGELGLPATNPVLFGLAREGTAGPILCVLAFVVSKQTNMPTFPFARHWRRFLVCGIAIFMNQFCAITGIKLAGGVAQSVWQPTQPIFSLCLAIAFGMEKASVLKVVGIVLAFCGVAFMVLIDAESKEKHSVEEQVSGHFMFFLNCLGTAVYVVCGKPLLKTYHPIAVTGYSYIIASVAMAIACVVVNSSDTLLAFVCPPDDGSPLNDSCGNGWHIPSSALWALAYWIVFTSIVAYCLMTWGNQYADASLVCAYTVLQPVAASVMTAIVIAATSPPHFNLHAPGLGEAGVVLIFAGLLMVVYDAKKSVDDGPSVPGQEGESISLLSGKE